MEWKRWSFSGSSETFHLWAGRGFHSDWSLCIFNSSSLCILDNFESLFNSLYRHSCLGGQLACARCHHQRDSDLQSQKRKMGWVITSRYNADARASWEAAVQRLWRRDYHYQLFRAAISSINHYQSISVWDAGTGKILVCKALSSFADQHATY